MKVNISHTVVVSDDERKQIAQILDGEAGGGGRAREATREECKAFVWQFGAGWVEQLGEQPGGHGSAPDNEALLGDIL